MTPRRREKGLVRPYVVTDGRAYPTRNTFDLVTLVIAAEDRPLGGLSPEKRRVVELCRGGSLSVAEVSGHLTLPVSVTKVLLADLVDSGHVITRAPIPKADLPDIQLLQEVLNGLRARL
jgi:DNA-directed RNA polymerase specialized sigma24 family protein